MEVLQTNTMIVRHDAFRHVFNIQWLAPAATMPENEFKTQLLSFVSLLRKHQIESFLVDSTIAHIIMTEPIQEWHDKVIAPVYIELGIRKIAFAVPANDVFATISIQQTFEEMESSKLQTRYFDNISDAESWIYE